MNQTKKKYSFYARHELLDEPISGVMYAYNPREVLNWVINRVADVSNTDIKKMNAPDKFVWAN